MKNAVRFQDFLIISICIFGCLSFGESVLWSAGRKNYPVWLMSDAPGKDLLSLRKSCANPLEIEPYRDDIALVRCGVFWPMRSVWMVPVAQVKPALK
jgi:hypothetical protein